MAGLKGTASALVPCNGERATSGLRIAMANKSGLQSGAALSREKRPDRAFAPRGLGKGGDSNLRGRKHDAVGA